MDVKALDGELNQAILNGRALEAFEKFYADDVVMQENSDEPFVGKEVNRKREQEFFSAVENFHGATLRASAIGDDGVSFGEWTYDITFKGGSRVQMNQAVVRRWKDGQVASERFYYNKG